MHLGTQTLTPQYDGRDKLYGIINLFGYYDSQSKRMATFRNGQFTAKQRSGGSHSVKLLPKQVGPWELSPWPHKLLLAEKISMEMPLNMELRGLLWTDAQTLDYQWFDADEGVAEANEIKRAEFIYSNVDSDQIHPFLQYDEIRLSDVESDDETWDSILASDAWQVHSHRRQRIFRWTFVGSSAHLQKHRYPRKLLKSSTNSLAGIRAWPMPLLVGFRLMKLTTGCQSYFVK